MSELVRLPNTANPHEAAAILNRDGGVIVENFVAPETLQGLRRDLFPLLAEKSTGRDDFTGNQTRGLSRLFAHTRHVAEVATHPLFLDVAELILCAPVGVWHGEHKVEITPDVRIGATQAIQIGPGQGAQPLHRDDTVFLWRHPTFAREARLQIMVAISDFTAENGGTLVIPGSNKWDDERAPRMNEAIPTVMAAGSALLFVGSAYHAGGTNRTESELRTGLTMALDSATLRQEENMYLSLSPEVVASYPERVQRLLGWSAGRNHMGWIEIDGQLVDPNILLKGETHGELVGVGGRV